MKIYDYSSYKDFILLALKKYMLTHLTNILDFVFEHKYFILTKIKFINL